MTKSLKYIACSSCFKNQGLQLIASSLGEKTPDACPNCAATEGAKLTENLLIKMARLFFEWGSFRRMDYGGAPLIKLNDRRSDSEVNFPYPLSNDVDLLEDLCGIELFYYGTRLWMIGEI
ncbi:hypothetical protein [Dethiosulfatarculus sandiegensis]|uniref:hypothetical protein n=1 Tax=Dethiosulfatarculus sandiegensis TaxID=1429043 RepID=UPI0012E13FD9|nr:hypothetical protein [Dethiosulfatarculus sandiegensis]